MKMTRRIALLTVLVLLVSALGVGALARGSYLGTLRVVNCSSWVSLRSYPSTSASRVTTVPLGATVEGYYYNSEYTECYYNGMHGYILSTYLSKNATNTVSGYNDYLGKKQVINCNEFVTLRSYPSTSAGVVTRVAKGEIVDAYYYDGTFTYCYYNGLSGYILSDYLGNSCSVPVFGSYLGQARVINCSSWVSLRSYPSTSASRVTTVPLGAWVEAYYYNSEYTECYYNGLHGYILSTYLSTAASLGSNYLGEKRVVNCKEFVTLRSAPSTTAGAVTRVAKGETVDAYYYDGTFTYCYYNGLSGYILSRYLN